nr:methyl-accepting chemotaxis protein [Methanocaldococcus bathoardescens]
MLKNISVKTKILSILAILVLIITGVSLNVVMTHDAMKNDGKVINIAGKQRMLIQKMTKEAFMIGSGHDEYRKTLKETAELFDKTLNGLISGSEELGLPPAPDKVKPQLLKVKQLWEPFYAKIKIIYTKNPDDPEFKEALDYLEKHNMELLAEMNKAVMLYQELYDKKIKFANDVAIASTILGLLIGVVSIIIVNKTILEPLKELERISSKLANREYGIKQKIKFGNDEIGKIFANIEKIYHNLKEDMEEQKKDKELLKKMFNEIMDVMKKVANGDLTARLKEKNGGEVELYKVINRALDNLTNMIKNLKEQVVEVTEEVNTVKEELNRAREISDQVADAAQQVATAATDQSTKLQDITQELEETTNIAKGVYDSAISGVEAINNVEESSQLGLEKVEHAIETMQRIANVIDDLGKAIQELGDESKKINEITALIKDIAEQTGLLALNASIEAARAGEAGRGFAVVASEIKSLAEEIGKSVDDINKTITEIQNKIGKTIDLGLAGKDEVDKGVIAIDEVNNAFLKIKEAVDKAMERINEIKEGAQNAADNIQNALRDVQDVASISEEFAATAEELTASTEELNGVIEEISKAAEKVAEISNQLAESASKFKA